MARLRYTGFGSILVLVFLISLPVVAIVYPASQGVIEGNGEAASYAYTQHGPIRIVGDSDFEEMNFPGDGSEANPYLIEGYSIAYDGIGISIAKTSAYFVVRNCVLESGDDDSDGTWDGCLGRWHRRSVGIFVEKADRGTIESCVILTKRIGIHISKSEGVLTKNNEIAKAWKGIVIEKSQDCIITDNDVSDVESGIYNIKSDGTTISGNLIHNSVAGVSLMKSEDCIVNDNEVYDSFWGVFGYKSVEITLSFNSLHGLHTGIALVHSNGFVITCNEIVYNQGIGIDLLRTFWCSIHRNTIADNVEGNARDRVGWCDEVLENLWDDGVDTGNSWGDYSGSGAYVIPGDRGSVDRYPNGLVPQDTTCPTWDQIPADQVIELGEPFTYDVDASDENNIDHYSINNMVDFSIDDNGLITAVGELELGSYDLEVKAYDPSGNFVSAEFVLSVQDTTLPVVAGPADFSYTFGETGNVIAWQAIDANPATYVILLDDTLFRLGSWNSSSEVVEISADGLDPGIYVYKINFIDASGNAASDEVTVTVLRKIITTTTTVTKPPQEPVNTDPDPLITGAMTAGGVVGTSIVVLALAGLSKKE
ncbi:MAG: NosD domain-containing protein [Candidatus Sifarchaeia archaeon]